MKKREKKFWIADRKLTTVYIYSKNKYYYYYYYYTLVFI